MKQKTRLVFSLIFVSFLLTLSSCEAEKDSIQTSENGRYLNRDITFEQFKNEIELPHFSKQMSISTSSTLRTIADFDIDTTIVKSLERNFVVYTMKLDPKFEVTDNKFYNLIVYKDNTQEVVKQIIEYLPNSELAGNSQEQIYQFLQNTSKEIIYNSRGMVEAPICVTIVWEDVCSCGPNHTRDENCGCHSFHSQAHLEVVPCPSSGGSPDPADPDPIPNPNNNNPPDPDNQYGGTGSSNGDGDISLDPILPIANRDNCNDLKAKSNNQDFRDKMNELKADANGTTTGEQAFQTFSGTPKFSPKYSATASDPSNIIMPTPTRTDCTGFMHCHMNDPTLKNFAIFTPDDFIAQKYLIENSTSPVTSFTMYVTSEIQGVSNIYAIKITDIAKFNLMAGIMEARLDKYKKIWKFQIKETSTPEIQVNIFFKKMLEEGFEGFELYKSDENLQNWEQLKLNNSGNTIKIKC
jgi:hypothetical protein